MPDVILALLRIIFLGLVYLFVWQVARAVDPTWASRCDEDAPKGPGSYFSDPIASRA
jgi:hypothetical protein